MRARSTFLAVPLYASLQVASAGVVTTTLGFDNVPTNPDGTFQQVKRQGDFSFEGSAFLINYPDPFNAGLTRGLLELTKDPAADPGNVDPQDAPLSFSVSYDLGLIEELTINYSTRSGSRFTLLATDAKGANIFTESPPSTTECPSSGPAAGFSFCDWKTETYKFSTAASKVTFQGLDLYAAFDFMRFSTSTRASTPLPEPGSIALALSALAALGLNRRRSKAA